MKKIKLLLVAIFLCFNAFAQNLLTYINQSNEFFELLDKGNYTEAQGFFDESVKAKISAEALKNIWTSINRQYGKYEAVEGAQNKTQGDYQLVILNCKFSKDNQSFQFVYNKAQKLVGFQILPKKRVADYENPSYADTTKYAEKSISIKTTGHELAGMLTTPKNTKDYPVVILVHGSGPSDMDETFGPNKPFRDIALGLAAKGIATIRYVKRTLVYPNDFAKAYTVKEEVLDDALAAINFAKTITDVNKKQIFLLGHSLGGMLAPRIALSATDLAGIILAAAPARKFTDLLIEQNNYLFEKSKDTSAAGKKALEETLKEIQKSRMTKLEKIAPDSIILGVAATYWIDINNYNQVAAAKKFKNRIFIIQGENDFQVSVTDYNLWKSSLSSKKNASFKLYPELNHLLTPQSEKGDLFQYNRPGTVADYFIDDLAAWIINK